MIGSEGDDNLERKVKTSEPAICTIVTRNRFHQAKALMESVARHDQWSQKFVLLVDGDNSDTHFSIEKCKVLCLSDLSLENMNQRLFRYDALEMCCSLKPEVIRHLVAVGFDKVIYLDADMMIYAPMAHVLLGLEEHDLILTPHILDPQGDHLIPTDLDILRAGIFNAGFLAIRSSPDVLNWLEWWTNKLQTMCLVDLQNGILLDQRWMELGCCFVAKVLIDRHPGMNVAYWNVASRSFVFDGSGYKCNDHDLIAFHFSGFVPSNLDIFSVHETRFKDCGIPDNIKQLLAAYADLLKKSGMDFYTGIPYKFDYFPNRDLYVDPNFRKIYRENEQLRQSLGDNPFDVSDDQLDKLLHFVAIEPTDESVRKGLDQHDDTIEEAIQTPNIGNLASVISKLTLPFSQGIGFWKKRLYRVVNKNWII